MGALRHAVRQQHRRAMHTPAGAHDASPLPLDAPAPVGAVRYQRHRPEDSVLYRLVEQHFPAFERRLAERERPLPGFVLDEFRSYLACGRMEHGFIRVKCDGCRHELLVAFSCKRRGICPSCGARRMVETAAHLIDNVIPRLPVRQWVLSFPWGLRMLFAARPEALTRCLDVVVRCIETHLLQRAGVRRRSGARTGVVTLIQRHGSAANVNVHLHMLVLDGVVEPIGERMRFRPVAAPSEAQLQRLLTRLIARMVRRLTKDGWLSQDTEPPSLDLEPRDVVDELAAALLAARWRRSNRQSLRVPPTLLGNGGDHSRSRGVGGVETFPDRHWRPQPGLLTAPSSLRS